VHDGRIIELVLDLEERLVVVEVLDGAVADPLRLEGGVATGLGDALALRHENERIGFIHLLALPGRETLWKDRGAVDYVWFASNWML
jgi:hypothetical protein